MKKPILTLILSLFSLSFGLSQNDQPEINIDPMLMTCNWPSIRLLPEPSRWTKEGAIRRLNFMEEVFFTGKDTVVIEGKNSANDSDLRKRTYKFVETVSGERGWVYEYYFHNGKLANLKSAKEIYPRANTNSAVVGLLEKDSSVVVTNIAGDWVQILTMEKKKPESKSQQGWIKGIKDLELESGTLAIQEMIDKYREKEAEQLQFLESIRKMISRLSDTERENFDKNYLSFLEKEVILVPMKEPN